jgi:hypothetical protein
MKYQTEFKWASILFTVTLLWKVFEKIMGWHGPQIEKHALYSNMYDLLFVTIFVFALLGIRKKRFAGEMTWKQGFLSGLIITVLITAVSPITQFLAHKVISPEFFPNIINLAVENGVLSSETAEAKFNLNNYILENLVGTAIIGTVCALLLPLFMMKKH